jgi:hypothetical protein
MAFWTKVAVAVQTANKLGFLASDGLGYFAGTDAGGANVHAFDLTGVELYPNLLQVGFKNAFGLDVGMADVIADLTHLSAQFTLFRHGPYPPRMVSDLGPTKLLKKILVPAVSKESSSLATNLKNGNPFFLDKRQRSQ